MGAESESALRRRRIGAALLAFLVALFVLRLWYAGRLDLIPDEAYYWSWSRSPDICYYDQPGMVAWINAISTAVLGQNEYGVRAPALVLAAGSSVLVYLIVVELFASGLMALAAVALLNLLPIFAAGGVLFIHDNPLMFFWTLALYLMARIVRTGRPGTWYALGLAVAGALYSKFSGAMIVPCLLLFVLLSPSQRHWLRRREPYLAGIIAAVLFVPVLAWNARNGWVSYLAVDKLANLSDFTFLQRLRSVGEFLLGQAGLATPVVFAACLWAMTRRGVDALRQKSDAYLLLTCTSLPVFLYFLVLSWRTVIQANWPMAVYLSGTILVVQLAWERIGRGSRAWRGAAWIGAFVCLAFAVVIHIHPLKRIVPYLEGRDLTDQAHGWKGLADRVDRELRALGVDGVRVMARKYQVASELFFYLDGQPLPLCANYSGRGNQYDLWNDFPGFEGGSAILVDNSDLSRRFMKHFDAVEELEPHRVLREGRVIEEFKIYRCMRFRMEGAFLDYLGDPLGYSVERMLERKGDRGR